MAAPLLRLPPFGVSRSALRFLHEPPLGAITATTTIHPREGPEVSSLGARWPKCPPDLCVRAIVIVSGTAPHPSEPSTTATVPLVLCIQRSPTDSGPNLWETPGGACDWPGRPGFGLGVDSSSGQKEALVEVDRSILHATVRELAEESGLVADRVVGLIGWGDYTIGSSEEFGKEYAPGVDDEEVELSSLFRRITFLLSVRGQEGGRAGARWIPTPQASAAAANDPRTFLDAQWARCGLPPVTLVPEEHQAYAWLTEEEVRSRRSPWIDGDIEFTKDGTVRDILRAFELVRELEAAEADEESWTLVGFE